MITTLAWVVFVTGLSHSLRQARTTPPQNRLKRAIFSLVRYGLDRPRPRDLRSHPFGNLGISPSYARHAGQKSTVVGIRRRAVPARVMTAATGRSGLFWLLERRHHRTGEQVDRLQRFRERHVAEGEPRRPVIRARGLEVGGDEIAHGLR